MDEDKWVLAFLAAIFIMMVLYFLSQPATGNIFGNTITMPIAGWIGAAAFAIIALILYIKHRA